MGIQSLSFWQQDRNYWNQQSFYQQDQNYWTQAQAQSQASSADAALINVMASAETNLSKGLSSIANQTALNRVNSQISAIVQQVLQSSSGSSSSPAGSSGTSSNSTSNSGSTASPAGTATGSGSPATGTGTVPLTTSTSLATLGILPGGTITVGTGANITTYTSTGSDTVADLLNAINLDLPTNANVTASLNPAGRLVITGRDKTSAIFVGGSGNDPAAIGFGLGNNTFLPKAPSSSSSTAASASSSSSTGSSSNTASASTESSSKTTTSGSTPTSVPSYLAVAEQGVSTAAGILSADGVSGTLVDMLA